MESDLLQKMKIMNGALDKELRTPAGEIFVEAGGFRYDTKRGGIGGNTRDTMILVSVGSEFPVGKVVHPQIRNPALAEKTKQMYGPLPFIVPGLHEEAAADLMATATPELKAPDSTVVKLYLDIPMMQKSKHYYLNKIQEFLQHCNSGVGMHVATNIYIHGVYYPCHRNYALYLYIHSFDKILRPQ